MLHVLISQCYIPLLAIDFANIAFGSDKNTELLE
jgi:hypothetical protein